MTSLTSRLRGARLASTPAVLVALAALSTACAPMARQSVSAGITPVTVTSAVAPADGMDITYLTPVDALLRYDPTHGAGAIVVRARR